jgi:hypothetical protein
MNDNDLQVLTRQLVKARSDVTVPHETIWERVAARRQASVRAVPVKPTARRMAMAASLTLTCAAVAGALGLARGWMRNHATPIAPAMRNEHTLTDITARAVTGAASGGWPDLNGGRGQAVQLDRRMSAGAPGGLDTASSVHPATMAAQGGMPPVRPLGPIVATTTFPLESPTKIRPLSDGRVLVNDAKAKRVLLFDASLAHATIVADTTGETARAYGAQGGELFPYAGDSSLYLDMASRAFLVIDPSGKLGRAMPAPTLRGGAGGGGVAYLRSALYGPTVDQHGNVVSRGTPGGVPGRGAGPGPATAPSLNAAPVVASDSGMIVRINIESRRVDTVAWLMAPVRATVWTIGPTGSPLQTLMLNPMPLRDAWTLMPDGAIAVVREHDYHIDWVALDGSVTSSPKIPHEWAKVTDSAKKAMIDSARTTDSARVVVQGRRIDSLVKDARAQGLDVTTGASGGVTIGGKVAYPPQVVSPMIGADDLPTYAPPFDQVGPWPVWADADGNVWIQIAPTPRDGGAVYDVVDRQGRLIDRIQIPGMTGIVGFGKGVVYLIAREGEGYTLARARIR